MWVSTLSPLPSTAQQPSLHDSKSSTYNCWMKGVDTPNSFLRNNFCFNCLIVGLHLISIRRGFSRRSDVFIEPGASFFLIVLNTIHVKTSFERLVLFPYKTMVSARSGSFSFLPQSLLLSWLYGVFAGHHPCGFPGSWLQ